jgi:hypothetical protein
VPLVRKTYLPVADPGPKTAHEAIPLWQGIESIECPPVDYAKVSGIKGDINTREGAKNAIVCIVCSSLQKILLAFGPDCVDDIVSFAALIDERS